MALGSSRRPSFAMYRLNLGILPGFDVLFWPEAEVGGLRRYQSPPPHWPGSLNTEIAGELIPSQRSRSTSACSVHGRTWRNILDVDRSIDRPTARQTARQPESPERNDDNCQRCLHCADDLDFT